MKILLIDDHHLFSESLKLAMQQYAEVSDFIYITDTVPLFEIIENFNPSLILIDIHLKEINGFDVAQTILNKFNIKIAFLSGFIYPEYQDRAKQIGANGFFSKDLMISDLIRQCINIVQHDLVFFPSNNEGIERIPKLTKREQEILQLIAEGLTESEISSIKFLSERTINNTLQGLRHKFQVKKTVSVIAKAYQYGILTPK